MPDLDTDWFDTTRHIFGRVTVTHYHRGKNVAYAFNSGEGVCDPVSFLAKFRPWMEGRDKDA
jgi:hypothetical protein